MGLGRSLKQPFINPQLEVQTFCDIYFLFQLIPEEIACFQNVIENDLKNVLQVTTGWVSTFLCVILRFKKDLLY